MPTQQFYDFFTPERKPHSLYSRIYYSFLLATQRSDAQTGICHQTRLLYKNCTIHSQQSSVIGSETLARGRSSKGQNMRITNETILEKFTLVQDTLAFLCRVCSWHYRDLPVADLVVPTSPVERQAVTDYKTSLVPLMTTDLAVAVVKAPCLGRSTAVK